jgi:hypothetical protein
MFKASNNRQIQRPTFHALSPAARKGPVSYARTRPGPEHHPSFTCPATLQPPSLHDPTLPYIYRHPVHSNMLLSFLVFAPSHLRICTVLYTLCQSLAHSSSHAISPLTSSTYSLHQPESCSVTTKNMAQSLPMSAFRISACIMRQVDSAYIL